MTDQATHVALPAMGGYVVYYLAKSDSPSKSVWIVPGTAEAFWNADFNADFNADS